MDILSPSGDFLVTGSWDSSSPLVKLVGEPPIDIAHLVGTPTEGKCTYWDRHRGWGKILIRGTSMRVFAHCRDIVSDVSSLPRDARVTLVLEQERGNHERQNKYVAKMIRIVDTRNEKDMSDEESDKPI